jgi:hypothetical protein
MKRKSPPPTAPAAPAAVPAPLAASPPTAHQPGRAAAGPASRNDASLLREIEALQIAHEWKRTAAEANARAEHWAVQADRLARQVEQMREAMEAVADEVDETTCGSGYGRRNWAGRLRAAAKGGDDVE